MLRISSTPRLLCNGVTRRDLLQVGGLGLFGLPLSEFLGLRQAQANTLRPSHFGRAKSCILIHLFGAHPQHETFDPKPNAPREIQGEMKAISTNVPGIEIGEGLPQVAKVADKLTMIRSLTHAWPFHAVTYSISGIPQISKTVEADPNDRSLWPAIGSVVDYLDERRQRRAAIPRNIGLPFPLYSRANFPNLGGPYGGFLGNRYDPVWTEFSGQGTKHVPNAQNKKRLLDPFGGIRPQDRFDVAGLATLPARMNPQRVGIRRALLEQFNAARSQLDSQRRVRAFRNDQEVAWSLLTSRRMVDAIDIQREKTSVRERYGMTLFGQSLLAARRLIEAGGRFTTVFWDAYDFAAGGWDTHIHHFSRLKKFLLPGFDQSFSALILDLEERGLLDETLVVCVSEHGRTPKLTVGRTGGGREHWSRVYCGLMAGGGTGKGRVIGRSDAVAGEVADRPISPKDILATAFHQLGIDPATTITDPFNRPVPIAGAGVLRPELLG